MISSVRNLPSVSRVSLILGVGSRHDVFCHVVTDPACGHHISAKYVKQIRHHVVSFRGMSCPTARHIISCSATPLPKTHFMSYRVRSCPRPCDMLPLFTASKHVLTVSVTCEIPCSALPPNASRLWISAGHKNSAQNVHARTLNKYFRPSAMKWRTTAPHTAPNAMRTQQDVNSFPHQGFRLFHS